MRYTVRVQWGGRKCLLLASPSDFSGVFSLPFILQIRFRYNVINLSDIDTDIFSTNIHLCICFFYILFWVYVRRFSHCFVSSKISFADIPFMIKVILLDMIIYIIILQNAVRSMLGRVFKIRNLDCTMFEERPGLSVPRTMSIICRMFAIACRTLSIIKHD